MKPTDDVAELFEGAKTDGVNVALLGATEEMIAQFEQARMLDGLCYKRVEAVADVSGETAEQIDRWIICVKDYGIDIFEDLVAHGISPKKIRMPHYHWIQRGQFITGSPVEALIRRIPQHVHGGVNSAIPTHLFDCIKFAIENDIRGDFLNLGVHLGWSMYLSALIRDEFGGTNRKVIGYDTFSGFAGSPSDFDLFISTNDRPVEIYSDGTLEAVSKNLEGLQNVELVAGDICTTCHDISKRIVAVAFVDLDDYTPTFAALPNIYEALPVGGMIIHDHYSYHTLGYNGECYGQRRAMNEFLSRTKMFNVTGTNVFLKMP